MSGEEEVEARKPKVEEPPKVVHLCPCGEKLPSKEELYRHWDEIPHEYNGKKLT